LSASINKALEKDLETRYQHAADLRADLKRLRRDTESGRVSVTQEQLRPHQWKHLSLLAASALALATIVGTIFFYRSKLAVTTGTLALSAPVSQATASSLRTIAVLPLHDLSGEGGSEVWSIGMADAIISRLATLKNLAVRPTNSVLKYAKGAGDPGQAASPHLVAAHRPTRKP
jgi:hypothetical protein